jgi:hypothetical protein
MARLTHIWVDRGRPDQRREARSQVLPSYTLTGRPYQLTHRANAAVDGGYAA